MNFEEIYVKINLEANAIKEKMLNEGKSDAEIEQYIMQNLSNMLIQEYEKEAEILFEESKRQFDINSEKLIKDQARVREGIRAKWGNCLNLSFGLYTWIIEQSDIYQMEVQNNKHNEKDEKLNTYCAMRRIHARACQQYLEVITLCENGLADGAFARWRSLYELCIIAQFVVNNGDKVAGAYIETKDTMSTSTNETYKWAKSAECFKHFKPKSRITFKMIEDECKKNQATARWDDFYKLSCQLVHPSAVGTYHRVGGKEISEEILISGATSQGIELGAVNSATSLCIITLIYWSVYTDETQLSYKSLLIKKIIDYVKDAYNEKLKE